MKVGGGDYGSDLQDKTVAGKYKTNHVAHLTQWRISDLRVNRLAIARRKNQYVPTAGGV